MCTISTNHEEISRQRRETVAEHLSREDHVNLPALALELDRLTRACAPVDRIARARAAYERARFVSPHKARGGCLVLPCARCRGEGIPS